MIKKIILGSLFLFSLNTFAQEGTASPYSFYGIGEVKFKGTIDTRAMAGIGILNDSIHLNLQNPAALSSLKLTTFTVAGTFSPGKFKTASEEEKAQRTSFDYLSVAFPVGKIGLNFGLMPYSSVGFKILKETSTNAKRYFGDGGLNRFFVAGSYQVTQKLSFGLNVAYNFGEIETSVSEFKSGVQFGSRELNNSRMSGLVITTGASYKTKIKKYDFITSATFSPASNLNSNNTRELAKITYNALGTENVWDTRDIDVEDSKVKLPAKFTIGSGIGQDKKWFVGFESGFQGKGDYSNVVVENASYEAASKISLGGYYIPKYNSISSYLKRITYRAGLRYENTGLILNSKSIKDKAATFGFGFPLSGFSNINFSYELGKRGTVDSGLIQENYQNFSVGLSFNDRWFVKRKYD
ncbi:MULTISPECIES: hypothetical protein [Flavobacterium]|uniref:Membrane protein n=1 Tax=Flavobacterium hankyongi TaxID=1176532 RepID=A0ABP8ZKC0_9FLAO|nr:hypothetical protein [Flavobacterium sp. N1846]